MTYSLEELLPVLQELTEKYTGKESTSVTYEKAQQLLGAVVYCIQESTGERTFFTQVTGVRQKNLKVLQKKPMSLDAECFGKKWNKPVSTMQKR